MIEPTDQIEALYDWRYNLGGTNKNYKLIAQADIDLLGKQIELVNARVCDVGCGGGVHLYALLSAGALFPVGIDLSGHALKHLLENNCANRTLLVRGDVTVWRLFHNFDAVVCSLPPLAHAGRMCLRAFTCTLHGLLKHRGVLLLKLFTLESVPSIVGNYAVQYEGSTAVTYSHIGQADAPPTLIIKQHVGQDVNDTRIEEVALLTSRSVSSALSEAGFVQPQMIAHMPAQLPGTQTFIARA